MFIFAVDCFSFDIVMMVMFVAGIASSMIFYTSPNKNPIIHLF